jgi:hypothetical protein
MSDDEALGAQPSAADLAGLASELQQRLSALDDEMHASWHAAMRRRWPVLEAVRDRARFRTLLAALLLRRCEVPGADRLARGEGRLALMPAPAIRRSLAALAIACRPGSLRCCIDREVRAGLEAELGPFIGALQAHSPAGRPVPAQAAAWSPLHWACLGYFDWLRLLQPEDRLLRRIVQLALPADLLAMPARRRMVPAELRAAPARDLLLAAGWPC